MKTMQSSHLQNVGYDGASGLLTVEFVNGAVYRYANVPFTEYYRLTTAPSPGTYFSSTIRDKYPASKIADAPKKEKRR